jgi:hypothetical protein
MWRQLTVDVAIFVAAERQSAKNAEEANRNHGASTCPPTVASYRFSTQMNRHLALDARTKNSDKAMPISMESIRQWRRLG